MNQSFETFSTISPTENINSLASDFDRIIICGSSNAGKSYIADIFRDIGSQIYVAHRFTTRPSRPGKNQSLENTNVCKEEFEDLKENRIIGTYWIRYMEKIAEEKRVEYYGFESDIYIKETLGKNPKYVIYSANNDFIRRMIDGKDGNISPLKEESLIIYIDCPEEERFGRMIKREDNLFTTKKEEALYRLSDDGQDVKKYAHIIIKNYGPHINKVSEEVRLWIASMIS